MTLASPFFELLEVGEHQACRPQVVQRGMVVLDREIQLDWQPCFGVKNSYEEEESSLGC